MDNDPTLWSANNESDPMIAEENELIIRRLASFPTSAREALFAALAIRMAPEHLAELRRRVDELNEGAGMA